MTETDFRLDFRRASWCFIDEKN